MRRRTLLAGLGAGTLAAGIGAAGLATVQPRRSWLVPPTAGADRPERVAAPARVVVVGGGIAGITAATELAARGFEVELIEAGPHLGGKVGAWEVRALGETFPVEHGFHGFFSQYYNLDEVLTRAGADPTDFAPMSSYPVVFPSGAPERFRNTTSVWPFNLASVIAGSERLHPAAFREADGLLDLMRWRGEETFTDFDNIDFAQWIAGRRIPQAMVDVVLRPFGDTTLNRIERLSAAEAIRFFHFYFLGNPEGLAFRALARDSGTAVLAPLAARMAALGVTVRTGARVDRVVRTDDRVSGVVIGASAARSVTVPSASLGDEPLAVAVGEVPVILIRRGDGVVAFDARCTHLGCPVAATPDGFRCPCHGGTFDPEGSPVAGPPRLPLARLAVTEGGGTVEVSTEVRGGTVVPCDACVLACEVRGLRSLVGASDLDPAWSAQVAALGESEPYAVLRFWLDTPTRPDRSAFATTTGFRYTDAVAVYSAFQEPYVGWARRTGGSVVETHAYAIAPEDDVDLDVLVEAMTRELRAMLPELASAKVLHVEAQLQSNFTRWAPGDHARRPGTRTPHPNLALAGDHVRIDAPVALMEGAAVSGRAAANVVLEVYGLRPIPIPIVDPRGVLA